MLDNQKKKIIKNVSFLRRKRKYISWAVNKHQLLQKQNRKYWKYSQSCIHIPLKIQLIFKSGFIMVFHRFAGADLYGYYDKWKYFGSQLAWKLLN